MKKIKGYNIGWFGWSIFCIFEIIIFCFAIARSDLVHDVEAIQNTWPMIIANSIWKSLLKYE